MKKLLKHFEFVNNSKILILLYSNVKQKNILDKKSFNLIKEKNHRESDKQRMKKGFFGEPLCAA